MKMIQIVRGVAVAAGLSLASAGTALAGGAFVIVDILPIHDGKTVADAEAYFDAVEPILAKHGMTRSDEVLKVTKMVRGTVPAQVINLWESDNPDASFKAIFSDKEYLAHTHIRDSVFDLKAATIIITERNGG